MGSSLSTTSESGHAPHGLIVKPSGALSFALVAGSAPQVLVKLKNTCEKHNVAFKLKTTAPTRYVVRPTHGVLAPGAKLVVTVVLQPAEVDDLLALAADVRDALPDKFQVQWLRTKLSAPASLVEDDFKSLWATVEKKHIHAHKLPCRFHLGAASDLKPFVEFPLAPATPPEATLEVSNPSTTASMAFKVMTTRPARYRVRPNQGVLRPGASATVLLVLETGDRAELAAMEPAARLLVGDKFRLQSTPIDDALYMLVTKKGALEGMDELDAFWSRADKAAAKYQKIEVRYVDDLATESITTYGTYGYSAAGWPHCRGFCHSSTEMPNATSVHALTLAPPDVLVFPATGETACVTLTNPSAVDCVAFRVPPTPGFTCAPTHGVLKPRGVLILRVTRVTAPSEPFHVQSVGVEANYCRDLSSLPEAAAATALVQLWASVDADHVLNYRLRVDATDALATALAKSVRLDTIGSAVTELAPPPAALAFPLVVDAVVTLVVSNPSARDSVTFQLAASQPKRYIVRPNHGVLGPRSEIAVQILLKPSYCEKLRRAPVATRDLLKDKLVVQALVLEPVFCRQLTKKASKEVIDDLTTLWIRTEKKRIATKKLRVTFAVEAPPTTRWALGLGSMDLEPLTEPESEPEKEDVGRKSRRSSSAAGREPKYCDCRIIAAHAITLDPTDSLAFALAAGSSPQAALVISNPSSVENVAFKVKTTRPMRYLVRPNQGVIGPNSAATVLVILQQKDCDELLRLDASERQLSNDKFLVQSIGVDAEFCDLLTQKTAKEVMDDLTTLWATAEKKAISNKKLRCRFVEGNANDVSTPSQLTSALLETPATNAPAPTPLTTQQSIYASTAEDSIRQEMMAEMAVLRKKYDELVAFTVQLTAQRDTLMSDLDKTRQQNQKLTTEQQRLKRQTSDMSTLRQRRPEGSDDLPAAGGIPSPTRAVTPPPAKPLTLFHILICAILFFLVGRYYG
ncbi:hypothetical protein ACHHYP_04517 [Achlya hypogyna]|uniref:MSP domain-containing protein n=1 Tax=Achlya hypogyna TaxID=1202772 RepID=A0A1V9Z0W5_ACHHY|nr:hypothetical protein ACHHYP_04517 [Achlya hypogyna]